MYVCICNAITDTQIRRAAESGVRDLWQLQKELGVASNCGKCGETAASIIRETRSAQRTVEPGIYFPSTG